MPPAPRSSGSPALRRWLARPAARHQLPISPIAAQTARLSERVRAEAGVPDVVVQSAGGFQLRPLADTTPAEFDEQLRVNLRAAFLVARELLPSMAALGRGYVRERGQRRRSRRFSGERRVRRREVRAARAARDAGGRVSRHRRSAHPGVPGADRHRDLGPVRSRRIGPDSRPGPPCCGPRMWPRRSSSSPPGHPPCTWTGSVSVRSDRLP